MDEFRKMTLLGEARYLHSVFFGDPGPEIVWERYAQVHEYYGLEETPARPGMMEQIIKHGLDLEAVEYVLRLRDRGNIITRKVEIIHYLSECFPQRHDDFFLSRDIGWKAWMVLARTVGRAAWCYVLGVWQIRRYGLCAK